MKIAEVYSHLNGLEFLKVHRPKLWRQVESVIQDINAAACKIKVSAEKGMVGDLLCSPVAMNKQFCARLQAHGWKESRVTYWVTKKPN
jgi:hypothetical protein